MVRSRSSAAQAVDPQSQPAGRDNELNRAALLSAAALEFASHGLKGANLEAIARSAGITRAMVYYYFGGREGLYVATLEEAYRGLHEREMALAIDDLPPLDAMRKLVEFRIDYYAQNPTFVALVGIENQLEGAYLRNSGVVADHGTTNIARTRAVLQRGQRAGVFRKDVDPLDLHQIMVSLGMFNVSNRHTFGLIFGRDLGSRPQLARMRRLAIDVVTRYLAA